MTEVDGMEMSTYAELAEEETTVSEISADKIVEWANRTHTLLASPNQATALEQRGAHLLAVWAPGVARQRDEARAEVQRAQCETTGVREELTRMAGDLDDRDLTVARLQAEAKRLEAEAKQLRHELAVTRTEAEGLRTLLNDAAPIIANARHITDQGLWGDSLGVAWRRGAQEWRRRYHWLRDADARAQDAAEEREAGADAHTVPLAQAMGQVLAMLPLESQADFLAGFVAGEAEASAELSEAEVATTRKPSDLRCAHCGRGGLGRVRGYSVCHPNDDARPDCYRLVTVHRHPVVGCLQCATVAKGMWYPEMPPALPGEDSDRYSNRLIGVYGNDLRPYDHRRNRQCSLGWHNECSDPEGETCECPCHRGGTDYGADATTRMPICNVCGHRHRSGGVCADHSWNDSCRYEALSDCDNTPTAGSER